MLSLAFPVNIRAFLSHASGFLLLPKSYIASHSTLLTTAQTCRCLDRFRAERITKLPMGWAPGFEGSFRFE